MKVRKLACAVGLLAVGCGGKKGTIELDLVLPELANPLGGGATIDIIAGPDTGSSKISKTTSGNSVTYGYSISFDEKPPKTAYNLVVQILDATGDIIGYGETPKITLNAVNQGPFGVWVAEPGTIGASPSPLTAGATQLAGCNVNGLGGVIAGGQILDAAGMLTPTTTTYVYDAFTSAIIDTSALTTARVGAVAVPATAKGVVFGGSSTLPPLTSLATTEAFDPTSGGAGQWIAVPGTTTAAAYPSLAILSDGTGLATGGFDSNGNQLNTATAISAGDNIMTAPTAMMTSLRSYHASAWMLLGGGAKGAILVGGLSATPITNSTIVEEYVNGTFTSVTTGNINLIPNLWNATATTLSGGAGVLIAGGGVTGGVATNSLYYVTWDQTNNVPLVQDLTKIGTNGVGITARKNHTATLVGNDVLLCGGIGADGKALGTCDVVVTNPTFSLGMPVGGLTPRQNHVAIPLETGPVVFAGGDDGAGTLTKQIDIYTPTMAEEALVNMANGAIIGKATADGGT